MIGLLRSSHTVRTDGAMTYLWLGGRGKGFHLEKVEFKSGSEGGMSENSLSQIGSLDRISFNNPWSYWCIYKRKNFVFLLMTFADSKTLQSYLWKSPQSRQVQHIIIFTCYVGGPFPLDVWQTLSNSFPHNNKVEFDTINVYWWMGPSG